MVNADGEAGLPITDQARRRKKKAKTWKTVICFCRSWGNPRFWVYLARSPFFQRCMMKASAGTYTKRS